MEKLFESGGQAELSPATLLIRMGWALVLGALLAARPLSRLFGGRASRPDIAYAVLLMTVASSLVIVIIGDSLARAFGIVGLGSFVRFRSSIKDPTDVVLFFSAIGVGMGCGLGLATYALLGVGVLSVILVARDRAPLPEKKDKSVKSDLAPKPAETSP